MPIWIELVFLLLGIYVIGLTIGWILWGREDLIAPTEPDTQSSESDKT